MSLLSELAIITLDYKGNPSETYARQAIKTIQEYLQNHYDNRVKGESWFCKGDMRLTTIECLKEILLDDHTRGIAQSEPKSKA